MQDKEIKRIDIVFENCEVAEIPIEYVEFFTMHNITESITYNIHNNSSFTAEHFRIILKKEADVPTNICGIVEKAKAFERIQSWNDIAAVTLNYTDNTSRHIYVEYKEEHEGELGSPNILQCSRLNENGELDIIVTTDNEWLQKFKEEDTITARKEGSE